MKTETSEFFLRPEIQTETLSIYEDTRPLHFQGNTLPILNCAGRVDFYRLPGFFSRSDAAGVQRKHSERRSLCAEQPRRPQLERNSACGHDPAGPAQGDLCPVGQPDKRQ